MKFVRNAVIAVSCAVFFLFLDISRRVLRRKPDDDAGVELRPLLGVVYNRDRHEN